MRTKEQLIDEAVRRGIVEGALIASPASTDITEYVRPISEWVLFQSGSLNNGPTGLYIAFGDRWATVITPALVEEEGLNEGDACECGPAMHAGLAEEAMAMGLKVCDGQMPNLGWSASNERIEDCGDRKTSAFTNWHTPEAFITKMRITAAKPKPIKIKVGAGNNCGEWDVKHEKGRVKIGQCTYVDNATVKAIAEKLID